MKTKPVSRSNRLSATVSAGLAALGLVALLTLAGGRAQAAATAVRIANTGPDTEGLPTFRLDWDASSNATYLVQSTDNLTPGSPWTTLDAVQPVDQAGSYRVRLVVTDSTGLASPPAMFYRLILPQPQIFSVEPAIVAPGVAVDFYVVGQSFPTNATLQINGVTQSGTVYSNSTTLVQPSFTPDLAGNYKVSLVVGGGVVSSFTVVCADPLANPELVLQGPPTIEPPAGPVHKGVIPQAGARLLFPSIADTTARSKRGYDYYKAQSDLACGWDWDIEQTLGIGSQASEGGTIDPDGPGGNPPVVAKANNKSVYVSRSNISNNRTGGGGGRWFVNKPGLPFALSIAGGGVDPFSGEVQECAVDLVIPGRGLDFILARTYHSRLHHTATLLDSGWTLSYDVRCAQNSSGGMDVYDGTGRKDSFALGTNGVYTCPEFFREGSISNSTFTLTFADTGRWVFNPNDTSAAAGKLHQVITRNGDIMTLGYDTGGRLAQIVDDLGRTNTVAYDTSGRVTSVTDFTGRSVTYQYYSGAKSDNGSAGDLMSVTSPPVTGTPNGNDFPSGKTTTYTYSKSFPLDRENHLLLTVTDPKGQTAAVFSYEHSSTSTNYLHCIAAQEGTNTPTVFNYERLEIHKLPFVGTEKCIVNDPVGNVSEYFFDARNRCVLEDDYTGRATPGLPVTDTVNRPTGKLRSSDPDYYEARWSWNNDSLCTSETSPGGQQMQYVYQSDFDPATTARKRADCRVVRELASSAVDLNGDGIPDVTARASYFTYDPRFGSDPTSMGATYHAINTKGTGISGFTDDGATYHAINTKGTGTTGFTDDGDTGATYHAINTKGTGISGFTDSASISYGREKLKSTTKTRGEKLGFCTSATDARGNVTTAEYDSNGCMTRFIRTFDRAVSVQDHAELDFAYDTHGQLTAITNAPDANGSRRVDTFTYYTSGPQAGYLQSIAIDESGVQFTSAFEYDARGNLTRVIDPRTNDWLYTYNALDQCVRAQSPPNISARCATDFAYDANDNLVQCATELRDATDSLAGGQTNRFAYDGLDRLMEVAQAVDASHALTNRFVYDGNNQCVQVLGGDAVSGADPYQTVAYQYDERGLLFHRIFAAGSPAQSTDQFSYTANLKLGVSNGGVELAGDTRIFTYDGLDRLATATDPMGNQTVCFYDANDNPKVVRVFGELNDVPGTNDNVRLAESGYQYDALDRCVSAQDMFFNPATQSPIGSGKATTTFAYAPNSECVSVTDALGHVTTYGYDTACRLVSVTDALGNQQSVVCDAGGNPLVEISSEMPAVGGPPQVFAITNVFDSLNRCVSTTDSAGNTSSYAYDSLDRCVQTTDPRGRLAFYSYDLLNRCTLVIGDMNGDGKPDLVNDITTTCTWSGSSGNLLAVTDSHTNTTSYAYDSLGRRTSATSPNGTHHTFVWNSHSDLASEQDANGTVIVHTYDLNDRCISNSITPGAGVASTTTFEAFAYDGCDRLTGAANNSGNTAFTYDSLDNCVLETLNGLATTSTYDALGNRLSLTYPGGRTLTYAYDALNRCASITGSGQQLAGYAYDGPDRVSVINYGNGTRTQIGYDGFVGTPSATGDHGFGQVSRVHHSVVAGGAVIDDRTFGYDPDQNKTVRAMTSPFTLGGVAQGMAFQYDPACRLVASLVTTNGALARLTSYGLDRMGNRTNVTGAASCSGDYTMSSTIPPADFQMNQYTTTPCDSRSYDSNGNLTSRVSSAGPVTYQYDYANRLVQVQALDSGLGTLSPLAGYSYDALGRRISKTSYVYLPPQITPLITSFLYDGGSVIEERAGGQPSHQWCWSSSGIAIGDVNSDGKLDIVVAFTATGAPQYFHDDDRGNTLALTDGSGSVLERYAYDDYGAVTFLTSDGTPTSATSSAVGNPYCWGGLRLDAETGLHNNDSGDYFDPQTGRDIAKKVTSIIVDKLGCTAIGNNPWSGGGGGGQMQKGTVKFFNEAKGFGIMAKEETVVFRPSRGEIK